MPLRSPCNVATFLPGQAMAAPIGTGIMLPIEPVARLG
jgi:hypothetical protein